MDPTPDEIAAVYAQGPLAVIGLVQTLLARLTTQDQLIAQLTAQVQELTDQQQRTSHNSHQPPASDGFKKQPRSLRRRSGKPSGGQLDHLGHTLIRTDTPDAVHVHHPSTCAGCGAALTAVSATTHQRHQVFDLPPLRLHVVEHQVATVCCPHCQHLTAGPCPAVAPEPVQYGPQVKALVVYLRYYQLLPAARTRELLADVFGLVPSEGSLATILTTGAARLAPVVATIRAGVVAAPIAHFDETGLYVEDKRYWLHVACTARLTYYTVHRQRGQGGSHAAGVLPAFTGTAVHDSYASYATYSCTHALWNAHILRELAFLVERHRQGWAQDLGVLLRAMLAATTAARERGAAVLPPAEVAAFVVRYNSLVSDGLAANPPTAPPATPQRGRVKQSAAYNLLVRLRDHAAEVLRFLTDLRVPFDNNQAERDVRMMKVQQKISGRFRTTAGAEAFCTIRSYITTLRKQGYDVLTALTQTFRSTPVLPAIAG